MLIRNFRIFVLYLAGMILLGHNFVPHHHHEQVASGIFQIQTEELEHDHEHHLADHSHGEEDEEDKASNFPFSIPGHPQTIGNAIIKQTANCFFTISGSLIYLRTEYVGLSSPILTSLFTIPFARDKASLFKSQYFSFPTLRGPPQQIFS